MHDIKAIRADPSLFDAALQMRALPARGEGILQLDASVRQAKQAFETAQAMRNKIAKDVASLRRTGAPTAQLEAQAQELRSQMEALDHQRLSLESSLDAVLAELPNILADDIPAGSDESANIEIQRHGTPAQPNAAREHFQLGEALGLMDFEAAARLSGSRFVVLRGALARLERALGQWMLDTHTQDHGYTETAPPYIVNAPALYGTGQLPKFAEDLFRIDSGAPLAAGEAAGPQKYLIPTAEVPLTNLVAQQIIPEPHTPLRFTALTPSFRSEAGSAGRDTRGMLRQHQFHKVEMVSITRPEDSDAEHERMTVCAEAILTALGLTWRRMLLCAGDTGFAAAKTYDLEVWLPGQQAWREISSCSNCRAFQARRMNARFKRGKETVFVHTLNGSGVAVGRALIAVMETHQQPDGSILIPAPLLPYMGGLSRIG